MHRPTRRTLLAGAGAAALVSGGGAVGVESGVLPGRSWVDRRLRSQGRDGTVPDVRPGRLVSGSFRSEARLGARCGWSLAFPPGEHRRLPLVVVLHGRGGDHTTAFSPQHLGLDRFLAAAVQQGSPPFALAGVDGGNSYWHPRADGEDAGAMVTDELLPLLARQRVDIGRIGFLGWSMGGFGSLRLAGRLGPDRVAGVAAESPALWHSFAEAAPGAFDDAADLADATVFGRQRQLDGIAVRVDCGRSDPFLDATRDYVAGFRRRPAGGFEDGAHTTGYWRGMTPAQLRFLARALTARA